MGFATPKDERGALFPIVPLRRPNALMPNEPFTQINPIRVNSGEALTIS
jgi:hypothetical protein